jgi:hypothetical protein
VTAGRGLRPRRLAAALALILGVGGGAWALADSTTGHPGDPYQRLATPACVPATLPAGQAHPAGEPEPSRPAWCYRLAPMPVTRVSAPNGWVDEFDTGISMGRLTDGDMDYRLFQVENRGARRSAVFVNNDHWMVDTTGGANGGMLLRPDRGFRFDNGRLVVEADVAAGVPEYSDSASAEIVISTGPAPTSRVLDPQYGYGAFGGHWTFGCRFQPDRQVTCALFNPSGSPGDPRVFGNESGRVWQMLPYEHVGKVVDTAQADAEPVPSFRRCARNQMDLHCRDRFRLELARDSVRILVNGRPYFEQSAIEPAYQLPDEFLNAEQYVYFSSWVNRPLESAYRFHWDRLAINPRDASGGELPASAAPSFGMASCVPGPHHGSGSGC